MTILQHQPVPFVHSLAQSADHDWDRIPGFRAQGYQFQMFLPLRTNRETSEELKVILQ